MKITFTSDENWNAEEKKLYKLELTERPKGLGITILEKDYTNGTGKKTNLVFKKETLSNFIGALLHLQSKLNKR